MVDKFWCVFYASQCRSNGNIYGNKFRVCAVNDG